MRNEYIHEQKKIGKYTVKVVNDEDPMNPREDFHNAALMICFHHRYNLGDEHSFSDPQDEELISLLKRKDVYWLPLYLYDHSGITMSTGSFGDRWDSGQVGYIYITREEYLKNWNVKRVNVKKLYDYLRAEVETYDNYLTGDVYGYIVEDESGSVVDSCWGFFGDTKDCLNEGISVAQWHVRNDIKKHVEQVKNWIRNRVPLEKRTGLMI